MNTENKTTEDTKNRRRKHKGGKPAGRGSEQRRSRRGLAGRGRGPGNRGGGASQRGGRRRPLAHGDLRLLILNIIETTPSHGYGLITEIKTRTSGFYEPSPGVIYPALEALQALGWAEVKPEKGKRVLHITKAGQTELSEQSDELTKIELRLQKLASKEQEIEPDDIRGALRQLKHETVSTFKGQQVDVEIRKQAVTILEDARKKIADLS